MRFLLAILLGAIVFAPLPRLSVQSPQAAATPSPTFEVASIKPTKLEEGHNHMDVDTRDGRVKVAYQGTPLIHYIESAYSVHDYEISGPSWIKSTRYDIDAIGPNPSNDHDSWKLMLQDMLADRFQLKLHRETRKLPIYELVVAKKEPKIGEAKPGQGCSSSGNSSGTTFKGCEMKGLADSLNRITGLPVVDKTGLKGRYDFALHFSRENQSGIPNPQDGTVVLDTSAPSIYTALQEQLGLKLKSAKGQVEVLVIDHIEPPSAN